MSDSPRQKPQSRKRSVRMALKGLNRKSVGLADKFTVLGERPYIFFEKIINKLLYFVVFLTYRIFRQYLEPKYDVNLSYLKFCSSDEILTLQLICLSVVNKCLGDFKD